MCRNENMEDGSGWTTKDSKTVTEAEKKKKKKKKYVYLT